MANKSGSLHVVMFPWLAFGHFVPFLELSKFIAQRGHKVSFISTPKNIDRLPRIPPEFASSITFVKIPLPPVDGLPENVEATVDLGGLDVAVLKKAYDGLEPELTRFLEYSAPDWIIYDFAPYWIPHIAAKLNISKSFFCIFCAASMAFCAPSLDAMIAGTGPRTKVEDFTVPPKWIPFESKLAFKLYESRWVVRGQNLDGSGVSDTYRVGSAIKGADVTLIRYCPDFEGQWLKLLEDLLQRHIIPLGLMPPPVEKSIVENNESWIAIKDWLDGQDKGSVVYVALGSEVSLNQLQLSELALGLELSGVPFFWALRNPSGLPEGFEDRVKGRGIVWKNWAPQLNVLSHDSVGGFLTHCGWSSSIEGLMFGHPLIMLPFVADTGLIARMLEEKQVGIEIPRNDVDGSYASHSVANSVRLIMVENEGKIFKDKAKEISAIFGDQDLHDSYLHKCVDYLENKRHESK
ncbi:putative UDP-rhamnose:rhamnosyltransferase 1 [Coffea arabica]|uniref:UDP-rhamnose:rhamnosyltransferase 1 n=1 Tax=Coffea arabica TaxID=13443 RepID=A0A6P6THH0_COFAR|nr:putative UDP-rhamnose:rhamnosyltransferase 1 [Coffea arabica]